MTFKELLALNKERSFPNQKWVRKRVSKKRFFVAQWLIISGLALSILAATGIAFFLSMPPAEEKKILMEGSMNIIDSIVANERSDLGMKVTSDLNITTTEEVSVEELKTRLAISPEREFKIKRTGNCKYRMEPSEEWAANTLYNVLAVYNENVVYRWAFQTETPFAVSHIALENAWDVGLDSVIEITFSHADVQDFESAFKIEPAVEGTFENYGRTWAFLPSQPMAPGTLYTVTIDAGLKGPGGVELGEMFSFSFHTTAEGNYAYMVHRQSEVSDTFLVDECPIAAVAYEGFEPKKANVTVYSFKNSDAYIEAHQKYVRSGAVSAGIMEFGEKATAEFETAPILADDYNGNGKTAFIHYPEPLPQGYYFAELVLENRKVYQLLQSTDLAVYTISVNGSYTAWVNDAINGNAVEDAVLYLDGKKKTQTNDQGFASFTGPSKADKVRFLTIENGSFPYVIAVNGEESNKDLQKQRTYYTYITTNSALYKTTDTIGVFGMVLPRKNRADLPDEVILKSAFFEEVAVKLNDNGSFSADLPIKKTILSEGMISLWIDGVEMDQVWIRMADYNRPTYTVSVLTDRTVYQEGDSALVSVAVNYPNGMPASGVSLTGDINGVTDKNGYFTTELLIEPETAVSYAENTPQVRSISCVVEEEQGYSVTGTAEFVVFNGDHHLKTAYADNVLKVQVNTFNRLAFADVHPDDLYQGIYMNDEYIGDAADVKILAEIHRITYSRKKLGTAYDPIYKKTYDTWDYTEVDELVETLELTSSNGLIHWDFKKSSTNEEKYYAILKTLDGETESAVRCELFEEGSIRDHFGAGIHYVQANKQSVDIGDSVRLEVRNSENGTLTSGGSVFYTVVAGEMLDHYYASTTKMEIAFEQEYAPQIAIYGAYFDGEHIYDLGAENVFYDSESAKLHIAVETDQLEYEPGDEVSVSMKVTNSEGEPVSAVVYASVLDRALYLLDHHADDPLYALYDQKLTGETYVTSSYRHFATEYLPGIEGGGGSSGSNRGHFENSPYWGVIETNRKGEASFNFKLPEHSTDWKAVIKAFTDDAEGACTVYDVVSGEEYGTSVTVGETLKTSDDCTVAIKTDGRGIAADSLCNYTVGLTDRDGNEIKTEKASALKSQYVYLNFGPLDAGVYTLYVQSESGAYQDNVIQSFQVVKSQNSIRINREVDLQASVSLNLKPAQGNVLLTVVDQEYRFWQKAMSYLSANSGPRIDQALGAYLAEHYYVTGKWMDLKNMDLNFLQSYYSGGGMRLFADAKYDDLRLASKIAAAVPDGFRRQELLDLFGYYLNDRRASRIDHLISYFGMAALGEPVMTDLQSLYTTSTDLTLEETVYMALAFAYAGDYDTANYLYEHQIKMSLITEGECSYIVGEGAIDNELTAAVSMLANRLSLDVAENLIRYLLDHNNETTLLSLELITYLSNYVMDLDGQNIFALQMATGENKTYQYSRTSVCSIELTQDQAVEISISPIEGKNEATFSYVANLEGIPEAESTVLSGVEYQESLKCGEETTIVIPLTLPEDFKGASTSITLPAGLHLVSGRIHCGTYGYAVLNGYDPEKLNVSLSPDVKYIMLTVRGSIPGSYIMEPIMITNALDQRYFMTDPLQISVTE